MNKFGYWVFFIILFLLSLPVYASSRPIPFQLKQNPKAPQISAELLGQQTEQALWQLSNQERKKRRLSILTQNSQLTNAARDHSKDMLKRNYLSHFNPEKKSVVDRVKVYVSPLRASLGENLHTMRSGQGLRDVNAIAELMMKDWMGSKSHRKNILSEQFSQIGVGCQSDGKKIYCTQVFAGGGM